VTLALEVLATGPLVLVEDAGRPGLAAVGVSRSGAADRTAYGLGCRLVGNEHGRAALEVLLGGLSVRARGRVTVTLTGALAPATVDERPVGHAALVDVADGSVLTLGMPATGLRSYVTVRGGIDVDQVLGSRSTDTLSGLGPPPVRVGDVLPIGVRPSGFPTVDHAALPSRGDEGDVALEVLPGPRDEWVGGAGRSSGPGRSADDLGGLLGRTWVVAGDSDRVGIRLTGATVHRAPEWQGVELPSEGLVRGAVQVPAGGEPVVFLADHPVTGGYPVVAVLTASAADRAAQLRPGDAVRLLRARSARATAWATAW
jgi:biotin-dependent carboxylase-like uncharacterized protein